MNPPLDFTRICEEVIAEGNKLKFLVSGGSMRPFLRSGDTVLVEPFDLSAVKAGDIVFYKTANGKLRVHRVIRRPKQRQETVLLTKGDALFQADPPVLYKEVLGKVIAIERKGRYKSLDGGTNKILNYFWLGLAHVGPFFYPLVRKIKKIAQIILFENKKDQDNRKYKEILAKFPGSRKDPDKIFFPGFKWDYFLQRALAEKIAPQIFKELESLGIEHIDIPTPVLEQFKNSYYHTLTRNVLIFKRTAEILRAFQKERIKVLIFKGPVLAELLYPDIGLRPITDIDILVASEDLAAADRILSKLNYIAPFEIKDFSVLKANAYRNSLLYSDRNTPPQFIHLYWHLLNLFPYDRQILQKFDMNMIWQSAVPISVNDVPGLTLSDTHQVIYLCLHAFQHAYTPGILLMEINKFLNLKKNSLDWNVLVAASFALGLNKYVYFGLYLACNLFGAPVPGECLEKLKPNKLSIFERRVLSGFRKQGFYGRQVNLGLVSLGMNETWSNRLAYIWGAIYPSKQEMALISQKGVDKIRFPDYVHRMLGEKKYRGMLFINHIMKRPINLLSGLQKMRSYRCLMSQIAGKDIIIRAAELDDKQSLRSVYAAMNVPEIEQLIRDLKKEGYCLIALKNKTIAGALTISKYEKDEKLWLIFGLETKPLFRGLGIARKLVQKAIERADAAGAREVGLFVNKKAIPALNLYHQAGFRVSPAPYRRSTDELYLHYSCRI